MKLTKSETKLHDECLSLLSLERSLTDAEKEFVFDNYHPGATNNIGRFGQFFTPLELAYTVAQWARGGYRYLDLCAGIGALAYAQRCVSKYDSAEIIAVEISPEFVEVGKRLVPEAQWVRGDAFEKSVIEPLGMFDVGISNPPYGRVPTVNGQATAWLHKNVAHLQAAEIIAKQCRSGGIMIMPDMDHDMQDRRGQQTTSSAYDRFVRAMPGWRITPESVDLSCYTWKGAAPKVAMVNVNND